MKPFITSDIPGVLVDHHLLSFDGIFWSMDNIAIIRYYYHPEGSMASSPRHSHGIGEVSRPL